MAMSETGTRTGTSVRYNGSIAATRLDTGARGGASGDARAGTSAGAHAERAVARVPALVTIAFGLAVLFCVGFLQVSAVHNGAHDTRHANGFPCH